MNLLTHGQAWWGKSAYSIQLMHLHDMLLSEGHKVAQSCSYGFAGRAITLNDITMLPHGRDGIGNDVIREHARYWDADYVISLIDVFRFDKRKWGYNFKWIAWATVDSAPLWRDIKEALSNAHTVVAYSKYGQHVLEDAGTPAHYIPLCYDPDAYYPVPMAEARERLGFEQDRFIVTMVQANRSLDDRKNFGGQLRAFRDFQISYPDALLHLHTCTSTERGGMPLYYLLQELDMVEGEHYTRVNQYTEMHVGAPDDQMRDTYAASNVLLQCTAAEAFGVPMLEANACGRPVIHTDHGANKEVTHGFPVSYIPRWHAPGAWYCFPDHDAMVEALGKAHQMQKRLIKDEQVFIEHAKPYRKQFVFQEYWKPFLKGLESELQWQTNLTLAVEKTSKLVSQMST